MQADVDRWNAKYERREPATEIVPDPLLVQHQGLLDGRGLGLDIAGGTGDNGLHLCRLGYRCVIVDASEKGLRLCRHKARANGLSPMLVAADLDHFALPRSMFDVVLVFRYLNRSLVPALSACLKKNGLLFFKTFNTRHLDGHPHFPADYVLRAGELGEWFSDLHCLHSNDGQAPDTTYHWVGRR